MENLSFNIATKNGTGSLSANQLLTKILFRAGWAVGSYNFFPSNIAGLPCLYNLRLNSKGYTGFTSPVDVLITLNPKTLEDDLKELKSGGLLVSDEKDKFYVEALGDIKATHWSLPITNSLREVRDISPKQRILFKNMIYVGLICEWLKVEKNLIKKTVTDFFSNEQEIVEKNLEVFELAYKLAIDYKFPFKILNKIKNKKEILIDGNTSSALGALSAGCQFVSWYPITPASSLAESFEKIANKYYTDSKGKRKFVILQSEDELASISQVIGAGWAGIRAMTVTSGPGLSLMAEGAGLSYFSEIPAVLYNVQRAGPSTGLPTRTQQGDLLSSCFLSHGGCKHLVLFPANPKEAFDLTAQAFDLAEELQTLVIVLSDLDLGMNLKMSDSFQISKNPLKRGKVLKESDFKKADFLAYKDEGDGISYRTLPGIKHPKGAYLNRGSGHNERAEYSERHQDYSWKLEKLNRKWETAKKKMPFSVIETSIKSKLAFVTFGPNTDSLKELRDYLLEEKNIFSNFLRVRSFPFPQDVESFLNKQEEIFVVEQNKDAQLKRLLSEEFPKHSAKMKSILQYDGRPLMFSHLEKQFKKIYFDKD
ncbi:MAG: 2-oxoacid:acceptor oxidoreductase subunit alpha [Bdellovibrionaceae bacterium]|nr:2-oxoacid:acceptor oxidoreductase subunit alpha [Pseudobdellovibrionaceae bacterium]